MIKPCLNCKNLVKDRHNTFCTKKCFCEYRHKIYIEEWKLGKKSGADRSGDISNHIRNYIIEKYDCKCVECGWSEINKYSGRSTLQVEHIDGNAYNHKEKNLTLLCPNCHSLTPTYGNLNRGHGRKNRRNKR